MQGAFLGPVYAPCETGILYVHLGQGRFKSLALLDEAGLLTAMAYVDLNPIRAGIAATPEQSNFTPIQARIAGLTGRPVEEQSATTADGADKTETVPLLGFSGTQTGEGAALSFSLADSLALVDWSGRVVRPDTRGAMDAQRPPIISRLNIDAEAWQQAMRPQGNVFGRALGQLEHLRLHARALGQSWIRGLRRAERLYSAG